MTRTSRKTIAGTAGHPTVALKGRDSRQAEAFPPSETGEADIQAVAAGQLKAIIERIERLEEEKKALQDDIKDVFAEAKANGFSTKALRQLVRLRRQDRDERMEEEAILELYKTALGMS